MSVLRLLSRQKTPASAEELLANVQDILQNCEKSVFSFDRQVGELVRMKERAAFAANLIDLRAMYIRQRILSLEELSFWVEHTQYQSQQITSLTQYVKINAARAKKMYGQIHDQYEQCSKHDSGLDHFIKRELHDLSDLDGKRLVSMYRKRPHLFRGIKQAQYYEGQTIRPRTAELKEMITTEFFTSLRNIEDPLLRPEEIDYKVWQKYCEFRRKKMESEMEFWIKHMELELYQGILNDYIALENSLQMRQNTAQKQLTEIAAKHIAFERNNDLVLTLTHGQIEADLKPFQEYNNRVILIPVKRIEDVNSKLRVGEHGLRSPQRAF